jgi:hypothetical protein
VQESVCFYYVCSSWTAGLRALAFCSEVLPLLVTLLTREFGVSLM